MRSHLWARVFFGVAESLPYSVSGSPSGRADTVRPTSSGLSATSSSSSDGKGSGGCGVFT